MPRRLEPSEVPAASRLLAEAFVADPVFRFLLPDEDRRRRWLTALMRSNLDALTGSSRAYAAGEPPSAVVLAVPPGSNPRPGGGRLFAAIPALAGATIAARMRPAALRAAAGYVWAMQRLHPRAPHWYVHVIGVHPDAQGEGLGSACLREVTALADADEVPTYLETGNPANLGYYARFGFERVDEIRPLGGEAPPMWTMQRPAQGARLDAGRRAADRDPGTGG